MRDDDQSTSSSARRSRLASYRSASAERVEEVAISIQVSQASDFGRVVQHLSDDVGDEERASYSPSPCFDFGSKVVVRKARTIYSKMEIAWFQSATASAAVAGSAGSAARARPPMMAFQFEVMRIMWMTSHAIVVNGGGSGAGRTS